MASIGVWCPAPVELQFGGVIGSVVVVDIVKRDSSRWFGPAGLVLEDVRPAPFMPVRGQVALSRHAQRDGDRRRAYPNGTGDRQGGLGRRRSSASVASPPARAVELA
jgi:hypothetical protein